MNYNYKDLTNSLIAKNMIPPKLEDVPVGKRVLLMDFPDKYYEAKVLEISPSRTMIKLGHYGFARWEKIDDCNLVEVLDG